MDGDALTRRWFIGGAVSFGALAGCRLLKDGSGVPSGRPNLTLGVVSDIHVNGPVGNFWACDETLFVRALEWFRDSGADGVVLAGDMANCGLVEELTHVGSAWRRVFPDGRAPDGRPVEKLFVTGNHDMGGIRYARLKYPGAVERDWADKMVWTDPARAWQAAFDEPYEPIWTKTVKGYRFVGAHWATGCDLGADETFNNDILSWYERHGREIDPSRPFFHIQHPHPKNTCYGPWAWGRDVGLSTQALSRFPNAIALSGHSHYSLTDERTVWQGAFTSVGTSSLRNAGVPRDEFGPYGYENTRASSVPDRAELDAAKLLPTLERNDCQQAMLWKVYEDCIVISRREFATDLKLGPDWVMPLPVAEPKPFAFAERAKKFGAPRFAEGAKLSVAPVTRETRGKVTKEVWELEIPACVPDPAARVFRFEVRAADASGKALTKRVLARGYNQAATSEKAVCPTLCRFAREDFNGQVEFTATPVNCFGRAGLPLVASAKV